MLGMHGYGSINFITRKRIVIYREQLKMNSLGIN